MKPLTIIFTCHVWCGMKSETKTALLNELIELEQNGSQFLDPEWVKEPVERYLSEDVFKREKRLIFRKLPRMIAHTSELPPEHGFLTRDVEGVPLLLTRSPATGVRVFLNVCRHRGARLVDEHVGCKKRFSCPYHAWTYDNAGELIGVPHQDSGFPGLQREAMGLVEVSSEVRDGWVWVCLEKDYPWSASTQLGVLDQEIAALDGENHIPFETSDLTIAANWKIIFEGGLEAYHFKVAHRKTIAPLFLDNLSSYQQFGCNFRSVLPRSSLRELRDQDPQDWNLRQHSNIVYTLFPSAQFLVQSDHFAWIQSEPLTIDTTRLRITTFIPKARQTSQRTEYWTSNHALTMETLAEDFAMAEGIQRGLDSGANTHLNFGRYEGALDSFNRVVDRLLEE